jgi:dTDP-glucose 4,6-dehydratase
MRNGSILMGNNQKNDKKGLSLREYGIVFVAFGVVLESLRTKSWYTLAGEPIPVYGDGLNVRADAVLRKGAPGTIYNVGGGNELSNIDLIHLLLHALAQQTGKPEEDYTKLITFVPDRPGHDRRYALDSGKLHASLGWVENAPLRKSLEQSIAWLL